MSRGVRLLLAAAAVALISTEAGAAPQPWSFVQSVGGLAVGDTVETGGHWSLAVQADVSGLSTFSVKPTGLNSGVACSKVAAVIEGSRIFLTIHTALASSAKSARCPDAELGSPAAGKYTVYYRGPGDEPVVLKEVGIGL